MKPDDVFKALVNKQLEKYNVDYDYVVANQKIEGQEWFVYYTLTTAEYDAFRAWALPFIRKELRLSKKIADKELAWFILGYGLFIKDEQ